MPGWIVANMSMFRSVMGAKEIAAIAGVIGGPDDWNTSAAMADAVSLIRSYCGVMGQGADGTIPPECRHALGAIFRFRVLSSIPNESLMTEARMIEYNSALKYLADIAAGRARISLPDPVDVPQDNLTNSTPSPWINAPVRTRRLQDLDGS